MQTRNLIPLESFNLKSFNVNFQIPSEAKLNSNFQRFVARFQIPSNAFALGHGFLSYERLQTFAAHVDLN